LLGDESAAVPKDERLVNWQVSIGMTHVEQIYLNSAGAELRQAQRFVPRPRRHRLRRQRQPDPHPRRQNFGQQGGADVIERFGLVGAAPRIADEALQLLLAPNTPKARATCC
jgi:predicted Zn-dependent protease